VEFSASVGFIHKEFKSLLLLFKVEIVAADLPTFRGCDMSFL